MGRKRAVGSTRWSPAAGSRRSGAAAGPDGVDGASQSSTGRAEEELAMAWSSCGRPDMSDLTTNMSGR